MVAGGHFAWRQLVGRSIRLVHLNRLILGLVVLAGCSQSEPRMDGGASHAIGEPIVARHAYTVQAAYRPTADGGVVSGGTGTGAGSNTFTLVVDPIAQIAIVGSYTIPLQRIDDRTFRATGSFRVATASCTSVSYDEMTFTPGSTGIAGSGKGREFTAFSDLGSEVAIEMSFTGGLDTVAPYVAFVGSATIDPLLDYDVSLSEPVLPGATATLVPSAGASIALTPVMLDGGDAVLGFRKPNVVLRYGETYSLTTDGIVDFGGNPVRTASVGTFSTRAAPPLIAEDGFESATDDPLLESQVVSGTGWPIIAGSRSLYSPVYSSPGTISPLSLRIALAPGDVAVRLSYRVVTSTETAFVASGSLAVGTVGGQPGWLTLPSDSPPFSLFQRPGNEPAIYLGEVKTAEIPIPAGSTGDLVIQRVASGVFLSPCGGLPQPQSAGLIIDDLRVE